MSGWILVLTILSVPGNESASLSSVGPFETRAACVAAGKEWRDMVRGGVYVCVSQKEAS